MEYIHINILPGASRWSLQGRRLPSQQAENSKECGAGCDADHLEDARVQKMQKLPRHFSTIITLSSHTGRHGTPDREVGSSKRNQRRHLGNVPKNMILAIYHRKEGGQNKEMYIC